MSLTHWSAATQMWELLWWMTGERKLQCCDSIRLGSLLAATADQALL
jgi:hypothetical protein